MALSIANLRAQSDQDLIAAHDELAVHTVVGTAYYEEELDRRSRERATEAANRLAGASNRLSIRTYWLAVVSTVLSAIATVAAVLALFLRG